MRFKIRNIDDFIIREIKLEQTNDPMREIIKVVNIEKERIIKEEIFKILINNFVEFEGYTHEDYTSKELIEALQARDIILEMEEPKIGITEQLLDKDGSFTYRYKISNPKIKLYGRLM